MNDIKFTNTWSHDIEYLPKPAAKDLPQWYKNMSTYLPDGFPVEDEIHPVKGTIKKCLPVFDAITSGYLIYTPYDLVVSQVNGQPYYDWFGPMEAIKFHPAPQAEMHPKANTYFLPKFINPWGITTPKGYSLLVTHPFHRDDLPFTTLPAVVDTDKYVSPINFIFILNDPNYTGLIPAGTPIAQVTPIQREDWKMSFGKVEDVKKAHKQMWLLYKIEEFRYKKSWWTRKTFS